MITEAILTVVLAPVTWLLSILPEVELPAWLASGGGIESTATAIGVQVGAFNKWFPVTELMTAMPVIFALSGALLVFKATQFVVSVFSGGGGST